MEFGEYGQILSNNTISPSYKIPKVVSKTTIDVTPVGHENPVLQMEACTQQVPLLNGLQGLWGNPLEPPPPPPPPEPSTSNSSIKNSLKRKLDEVKASVARKNAFSASIDPSLPATLTAHFQPLYCKLCDTKCSSSINAKLHYNGKNHDKKVRNWLIDYAKQTGEPLHKRAMTKEMQNAEALDPRYTYCQVCDLKFTSKPHAESHYMGKAHQKALSGQAPAGSGYFDEHGQWRRMVPTAIDPSRGDSFGLSFAPKKEEFKPVTKGKYYCEICNINCTNYDQLRMHLEGQKHLKKVRNLNNQQVQQAMQANAAATMQMTMMQQVALQQPATTQALIETMVPPPPPPAPYQDNILNSVLQTTEDMYRKDNPDLSVYRTPSGDYYCQLCNNTISIETQFRQHLFSKKHMKKEIASRGGSDPGTEPSYNF